MNDDMKEGIYTQGGHMGCGCKSQRSLCAFCGRPIDPRGTVVVRDGVQMHYACHYAVHGDHGPTVFEELIMNKIKGLHNRIRILEAQNDKSFWWRFPSRVAAAR